jgi:hypothetical protein
MSMNAEPRKRPIITDYDRGDSEWSILLARIEWPAACWQLSYLHFDDFD